MAHVALITSWLSERGGGVPAAVLPLAAALRLCNVSASVVGLRDGPSLANTVDTPTLGPRAFGWSPCFAARLADLKPDLIDSQGLWMYPSLASLQYHRRSQMSYVVTPHGMLDPWAVSHSRWKKRLVLWWFETEHLRRAACLRATAEMEAGHLRAFGLRNPIAVVPNGVNLPVLGSRVDIGKRRKRLLFLSRIHPKKGIDFLLRAWARLSKDHKDWELMIVGPDELGYRAEMRRMAASLGLTDVLWRSSVQGQEKSDLYRSADLFVLPTHAENFGLVIAEALAHEVPVITTTNAPWEGLKKHRCGWWIGLTDDALVAALDEGISLSDAERQAMGERGRMWMAQDFSWPAVAHQMQEVYTWVLGGGPPPNCIIVD